MLVARREGQVEDADEPAVERVDKGNSVTREMLENLCVVLRPGDPHQPPLLGGGADCVRAYGPLGEGVAGNDADTIHLGVDGGCRSPPVQDDRSMISEDDRRGGARQPRDEVVEDGLDRSAETLVDIEERLRGESLDGESGAHAQEFRAPPRDGDLRAQIAARLLSRCHGRSRRQLDRHGLRSLRSARPRLGCRRTSGCCPCRRRRCG